MLGTPHPAHIYVYQCYIYLEVERMKELIWGRRLKKRKSQELGGFGTVGEVGEEKLGQGGRRKGNAKGRGNEQNTGGGKKDTGEHTASIGKGDQAGRGNNRGRQEESGTWSPW